MKSCLCLGRICILIILYALFLPVSAGSKDLQPLQIPRQQQHLKTTGLMLVFFMADWPCTAKPITNWIPWKLYSGL